MRALRTFIGLVLVLAGLPLTLVAIIGWSTLQHRDAGGGFGTTLSPIHSTGYAVVAPDITDLVRRHGAGRVLGSGRLHLQVRANTPVVLALAPAAQAGSYLSGVARTEVLGVGFARGDQPVQIRDIGGNALPSGRPQWTAASPTELSLDLPGDAATSLVLMRADGRSGIDATLSVSLMPGWLNLAVWGLLLAGTVALLAGIFVIAWPSSTREMVLVVEANRMVDVADRIAEKLAGVRRPAPVPAVTTARQAAVTRQGRWLDKITAGPAKVTALAPNLRRPPRSRPEPGHDPALNESTGENPFVETAT
jgi:hypothetical protein